MTIWAIDHTHAQDALCWVDSAQGHPLFPVQNLPLGLFSENLSVPRLGVAIGDYILDVPALLENGLLADLDWLDELVIERLNEFLALGADVRQSLRHALFALLTDAEQAEAVRPYLIPQAEAEMHLPCEVSDFAQVTQVDGALLEISSARASALQVSPAKLSRPSGRLATRNGQTADLRVQPALAIWIANGNALGEAVPADEAPAQLAGFGLLQILQALDFHPQSAQQGFLTTVSPWIITPEALAPYFAPNTAALQLAASEGPVETLQADALTILQSLTQNGSRIRPGDLLGQTLPSLCSTPLDNGRHSSRLQATSDGFAPITLGQCDTQIEI